MLAAANFKEESIVERSGLLIDGDGHSVLFQQNFARTVFFCCLVIFKLCRPAACWASDSFGSSKGLSLLGRGGKWFQSPLGFEPADLKPVCWGRQLRSPLRFEPADCQPCVLRQTVAVPTEI